MKRLWIALGLAATLAPFGWGNQRAQGFCEQGNKPVVTAGTTSTTKVQASYPSCQVSVYLTGTLTLATLYSDNSSTPKANPFTADAFGHWFFYAANGRYDVALSGGGLPAPWTLGDVLLADPFSVTPTPASTGAVMLIHPSVSGDWMLYGPDGTLLSHSASGCAELQLGINTATANGVEYPAYPLVVYGRSATPSITCTVPITVPPVSQFSAHFYGVNLRYDTVDANDFITFDSWDQMDWDMHTSETDYKGSGAVFRLKPHTLQTESFIGGTSGHFKFGIVALGAAYAPSGNAGVGIRFSMPYTSGSSSGSGLIINNEFSAEEINSGDTAVLVDDPASTNTFQNNKFHCKSIHGQATYGIEVGTSAASVSRIFGNNWDVMAGAPTVVSTWAGQGYGGGDIWDINGSGTFLLQSTSAGNVVRTASSTVAMPIVDLSIHSYSEPNLIQRWGLPNYGPLNTKDFDFPAQTPSVSLIAHGSDQHIPMTPCPKGVDWGNPHHYFYISGGTGGAAEAVAMTGGTCTQGGAGYITVTPNNTHSGSWTIQSATAGIQEAIWFSTGPMGATSSTPRAIYIPDGFFPIYGTIYFPPVKDLKVTHGNPILSFDASVGTSGIWIDSCEDCYYDLPLLIYPGTGNGVRVYPGTADPSGFTAFVQSTLIVQSINMNGNGNAGLLLDGSAPGGSIDENWFSAFEGGGASSTFGIKALGTVRHNHIFTLSMGGTTAAVQDDVASACFDNIWDLIVTAVAISGTPIGADIKGGSSEWHISALGFATGKGFVTESTAIQNSIYPRELDGGYTNNSLHPNRLYLPTSEGFSTTTPTMPSVGSYVLNSNLTAVVVIFLTAGTGATYSIKDALGGFQSVNAPIALGTQVYLGIGESIGLTAASAPPTWQWRGIP
jgi:hypothetical protein